MRGLCHLGVHFDLVLHSPWQRAVETALELAPLTEGEVAPTGLLAAEVGVDLFDRVQGHASVALVGHEPWLGDLARLCLDPRSSVCFDLKKGGVLWLRGQARPAGFELVALLPPKVLARI